MPKVIDAVVTDGDGTLWKGAVSAAIGKEYLLKALRDRDIATFASGILGAAQVMLMSEFRGPAGSVDSQKKFYDTLIANGIGMRNEMRTFASRHIRKNTIDKVENVVRYYTLWNTPTFLSTMAGSTAAECVVESLSLTESVSNVDIFDNIGKLVGFSVTMRNGEEKLAKTESMLDKYNIRLDNCMVIGDSANDIPLLMSAKIAVASPFASDKVLALKRITRISS